MSSKTASVKMMLEAFWAGDWQAAMRHFAEGAVYEDPLLPEPAKGKAAILDVFRYCHKWGELEGEIRRLFGADDFVVAELRIRGTVIRPLRGMDESVVGKRFDFSEADVFEFNANGEILRETIYPDALTLLRQLGQS